jgi:Double zinc ribbon
MTDDLDRLFERLVRVLASDAPGRLAVPFPAAEVYERLVPYRSNRSTLRVATHQDYEMAVLRLLGGERGYVSLEPTEVQQALQREAGEQNPDTGLFRQFPDAILSLNRLAAERFLRGDRAYAPAPPPPTASAATSATATRPRVEAGEPEEEVEQDEPEESAASRATSSASPFELAEQTETPRQCPYCGETVPANRKVNFCPQCGQPPSGELRCPACGSEVDVGWRYCVGCGRATGFE